MAYLERAGSFLSTGLPPNAHPGPETAHSFPKLLKYTNGGRETAAIFLINQGWSFFNPINVHTGHHHLANSQNRCQNGPLAEEL